MQVSMPNSKRPVQITSSDPDQSDLDSQSSSEDVTEDELGTELTPALDAAILQTLGRIKRGEGVYGEEDVLGEAFRQAEARARALKFRPMAGVQKAEKPFLLADHHRLTLLSNTTADEDQDKPQLIAPMTNVQSERLMRAEALSAFRSLANDDAEEEGKFEPKRREKDEEEVVADEEEYRSFLLEMGGGEEEVRRVLGMGDQPVPGRLPVAEHDLEEDQGDEVWSVRGAGRRAKKKSRKKAKEDDDFLMNFILNRGWIDRSDQHIPTYNEVVGDDQEPAEELVVEHEAGPSHPWGTLDEDDFDNKAEDFEAAYNFRFEEPGSTSISTHPRTIPTLVRRPDDARKAKRAARAERKAAEQAVQEEETRRLKGEKRREAEDMLARMKKELGGKVDWTEVEKVLDGEWDEDEWERIVGGMFGQLGDNEDENDAKPTWDEEEEDAMEPADEDDPMDGLPSLNGLYKPAEDEPLNMDVDYLDAKPNIRRKKGKKRKRHGEDENAEDEPDLTLEDRAARVKHAMDEYKALDHEDMIGDIPIRFKYTHSAPTNFGLSAVEILLATDAELNTIAPVKTLAPYRRGIGMSGKGIGKRIRDLRDELKRRRWGQDAPTPPRWQSNDGTGTGANDLPMGRRREGEAGERKGKRLGRKERMKMKVVEEGDESAPPKGAQGFSTGISHATAIGGGKGETVALGDERGVEKESKKRRKKKNGKAAYGGLVIFD